MRNSKPYRKIGTTLIAVIGLSGSVPAQTVISSGHLDIGIGYEEGAWDLHIHDEANDIEYSPPSLATLQIGAAAQTSVPAAASYGFLGAAGTPVWLLPSIVQPGLIFLGIGTTEIAGGTFEENTLRFSLRGVTGPGHFSLFDVDSFGNPEVLMNSRDGIDVNDSLLLQAGSHRHANYAFSAPGDYTLQFEASGLLAGSGEQSFSDSVAYQFQVIPEPGTIALTAVGSVALMLIMRRRNQ